MNIKTMIILAVLVVIILVSFKSLWNHLRGKGSCSCGNEGACSKKNEGKDFNSCSCNKK